MDSHLSLMLPIQCYSVKPGFHIFLPSFPFSLFFQLSQAAASTDNRIPTPASVASADVSAQQLGQETQMQENKPEVTMEKTDSEYVEAQLEPKPEVIENQIIISRLIKGMTYSCLLENMDYLERCTGDKYPTSPLLF